MLWERVTLRHICTVFLAVVVSASVLASCGPAQPPGGTPTVPPAATGAPTPTSEVPSVPTAPAEQRLVIGLLSSPAVLDPNHQHQRSMMIYRLIYDKLCETDATGALGPSLATSWETVADDTWRFHLREGVSFHNGEPFNAESVKWTIEFNMDPDNMRVALTTRGVRDIERVEIVDEYTVDIITKGPNAMLPANLTVVDMLPAKYYAELGSEAFNQAPVGTGMFKYVDWRQDEYIRLEANEDYWGGAPIIKELEFIVIPEASSRVASLRAGEIDVAEGVPSEMAGVLEGEGFQVVPALYGQSFTIYFSAPRRMAAPLRDLRVRQALNYAIDLDAMVREIHGGWVRKLEGQLGAPDTFGYNPDVTAFPYDPDKARQLLEDAGYPDGFAIPMECSSGKYPKDKDVCQAVVGYLAEIGVTVDLTFVEPAIHSEKMVRTLDLGGEGLWNGGPNTLPAMDVTISYAVWTCDHPYGWWCNEEFDELYAQQNETVDPQERLSILHRMAEVQNEEVFAIFMFEMATAYGMRPGVQGMVFRPDGSIDMSNAFIE